MLLIIPINLKEGCYERNKPNVTIFTNKFCYLSSLLYLVRVVIKDNQKAN